MSHKKNATNGRQVLAWSQDLDSIKELKVRKRKMKTRELLAETVRSAVLGGLKNPKPLKLMEPPVGDDFPHETTYVYELTFVDNSKGRIDIVISRDVVERYQVGQTWKTQVTVHLDTFEILELTFAGLRLETSKVLHEEDIALSILGVTGGGIVFTTNSQGNQTILGRRA